MSDFVEHLLKSQNLLQNIGILDVFECLLLCYNGVTNHSQPLNQIYGPIIMPMFVKSHLKLTESINKCPKNMIEKGSLNITELDQKYIKPEQRIHYRLTLGQKN